MLRVNLHQQIAAFYPLIVTHRHFHHRAGHIGGHVDDVGAHPTVASPRCLHVINPQRTTDPERDCQHQQRGDQAVKLFHAEISRIRRQR
ncbi:FAD/FMN-containing dehydrogenase [Pseudomonas syringae pv. actinidiae]|uniref:FAD/FMN-containing dehydrogenase n=1 Tax=Pseudomonas syringae pv. actinidiae TaxID=103796 RepID=A0AAN4TJD3_PSESF|nr:FAD/FMN-containing dehydrogenase [Pseudomonas syringae pv. actinidiae]